MIDSHKQCRVIDRSSVQAVSETFDVLSDHHRRYVLHYLSRRAPQASLADLVDYVVDRAPDRRSGDRRHVAMSLHHAHLPKLEQHGLVEYDPANGVVVYDGTPLVEACLDHVADRDLRGSPDSS